MRDEPRPDLFKKFLNKRTDEVPPRESIEEKVVKAYMRMKERAVKRNKNQKTGRTHWEPKVNDLVLAKRQIVSDASAGVTSKFMHIFDGPWTISKIIPPSAYELSSPEGKVRGVFNKTALKPYLHA